MARKRSPVDGDAVRYAVVGLGWFAQVAVLPAFENARRSSRLAALVSGDPEKLAELGERYGVPEERRVGYDGYDALLTSGEVDAVYIALPNHLHRDYTVRAARAGVHVLCEKPMAVTEEECREMIEAAEAHDVRLMIAYRLHFEPANLEAVRLVQDCDETTAAVLRFPGERIATFVSSFGAADRDNFQVVGTAGDLLVEPAFQFKGTLKHRLTVGGKTTEEEFSVRDQIAPEILHFSRCLLTGEDPEPSGLEGLADVRIIQAIYRSAREGGRPVRLEPVEGLRYPEPDQERYRPAPGEQELVHESSPSS